MSPYTHFTQETSHAQPLISSNCPIFARVQKSINKRELLYRFNQALSEMKEDGSYKKIVEDFMRESVSN